MGGLPFVHARFVLTCALIGLSARAPAEDRWQTVTAAELKVGQARISRTVSDAGIVQTEQIDIQLGTTGRRVRYRLRLTTESTPTGGLRRLLREVDTPEGHSRVEARARGSDLEVTDHAGGDQRTVTLPGAADGLRSDEVARAWLAAAARGESPPSLAYRSWDPVKRSVVAVQLVAVTHGAEMNVERRVHNGTETTGSLLAAGPDGNVVRETMRLGAFDLVLADSTEAAARRRNDVFDHVTALLQKSPYRIPTRDMRQKIRYRFDNHGRAVALPAGAGQRTWNEGNTTWVQVCADCPLDVVALADDERARALQATPWLESDDAEVSRRAHAITARAADAADRMRRLTAFVRGHMGPNVDMLGYGTALEALRSRRGDCTEYAVLLAALGRAAGVPTRIAIGRVYARHFEGHAHVFVPHAWVQAWTGRGWQSFDAAIGTFDSTHIAFAVSYDGGTSDHFTGTNLARVLTMVGAARVVPRKVAAS
jgi:transglutaminase-like putative cysteine protease